MTTRELVLLHSDYMLVSLLCILPDSSSLSTVVSEAFVRFFVEMVGHYSLFMGGTEREDESVTSPTLPSPSSSPSSSFQRDAFRKAVTSKSLRRFLEVFMETQTFTGFIQERELRRQGLRGTEIGQVLYINHQTELRKDYSDQQNKEQGLRD